MNFRKFLRTLFLENTYRLLGDTGDNLSGERGGWGEGGGGGVREGGGATLSIFQSVLVLCYKNTATEVVCI